VYGGLMKRVLATAIVVTSLLSGCSAPYSAGAPSVFNKGPASAPPSPAAVAYTAPAAPEPVEPIRQSPPPAAKSSSEILGDLMFEAISDKYGALDVPLDRASYDRLTNDICSDMRQGGLGYFTTGDVSALSESAKQSLARSTWLVMADSCYPKSLRLSEADVNDIAEFLAGLAPEYGRRLEAAGLSTSSSSSTGSDYAGSGSTTYGSGSVSNGTGSAGSGSYGSSGAGYTVPCNDGSYSSSGGKRGACSWHGGVSR